jgi:hypothetical protein
LWPLQIPPFGGILKIPATRPKPQDSWGILEPERDSAAELGVVGTIDNAYAALAELLNDLIVGNSLPNHIRSTF